MKIWLLPLCFLLSAPLLRAQDLFQAARHGDTVRLKTLVALNADTVNTRNAAGFTPLIIASYNGQFDAVKFLLKHQATVNADSPEGSALLGVCYKGDVALARLLLAHAANANAANTQGTTALIFAVLSKNSELVKLLLDYGADAGMRDALGKSAADYAQQTGNTEILQLLAGETKR